MKSSSPTRNFTPCFLKIHCITAVINHSTPTSAFRFANLIFSTFSRSLVGAACLAHRKLYYLKNAYLKFRRYETHQHVVFSYLQMFPSPLLFKILFNVSFPPYHEGGGQFRSIDYTLGSLKGRGMKDDTELISSKHSPNVTTWNFIMNINFT